MKEYVGWIANVDSHARRIRDGGSGRRVLRVVRGEEQAKIYTGVPVWSGFGTADID
jgi:butyrate kinase